MKTLIFNKDGHQAAQDESNKLLTQVTIAKNALRDIYQTIAHRPAL